LTNYRFGARSSVESSSGLVPGLRAELVYLSCLLKLPFTRTFHRHKSHTWHFNLPAGPGLWQG